MGIIPEDNRLKNVLNGRENKIWKESILQKAIKTERRCAHIFIERVSWQRK